jgi:predicted lipase
MPTYKELFEECESKVGYITAGDDAQFKVVDGILYFQQSKGKEDWKNNLDFFPKGFRSPYKDMKERWLVHEGFLKVWKSIEDTITELLPSIKGIVGYSHGGPLACFAHEKYLYMMHKVPARTVVFGCPPFLFFPSASIKERFATVERIRTSGDIVAKLPTLFGLRHCCGAVVLKCGEPQKPIGRNWAYWLSGHSPEEYLARLSVVSR